jgi:hypothetical protein
MPHGSGLLSLEAQHIINRNKLYYSLYHTGALAIMYSYS